MTSSIVSSSLPVPVLEEGDSKSNAIDLTSFNTTANTIGNSMASTSTTSMPHDSTNRTTTSINVNMKTQVKRRIVPTLVSTDDVNNDSSASTSDDELYFAAPDWNNALYTALSNGTRINKASSIGSK